MQLFRTTLDLPQDLFPSGYEKVAARVRLPPDPQQWAPFILSKAMEALPALSEFLLDIVYQQQDIENATALGAILVSKKPTPSLDMMGQTRPTPPDEKVARIPLLVLQGEMFPLDLLVVPGVFGMPSTTVPLTERRIRSALFRDDIFVGTSQPPGSTSISSALYPGSRDFFYGGNAQMGVKTGSLLAKLAMAGTSLSPLRELVLSQPAFAGNPKCASALQTILEPPAPPELQVPSSAKVALLKEVRGGYLLKTASALNWEPMELELTRADVLKLADGEAIEALDLNGETLLGDPDVPEAVPAVSDSRELLKRSGLIRAVTDEGKDVIGLFSPSVIDFTGMLLPLAFFTNGVGHCLEPEVYGELLSSTAAPRLSPSVPQGFGIFYRNGEMGFECTVPMEIQAQVTGPTGEATFQASGMEGSAGAVSLTEGARKPFEAEGVLHLPSDFKWLSLDGSKPIGLQGAPGGEGGPSVEEPVEAEGIPKEAFIGIGGSFGEESRNPEAKWEWDATMGLTGPLISRRHKESGLGIGIGIPGIVPNYRFGRGQIFDGKRKEKEEGKAPTEGEKAASEKMPLGDAAVAVGLSAGLRPLLASKTMEELRKGRVRGAARVLAPTALPFLGGAVPGFLHGLKGGTPEEPTAEKEAGILEGLRSVATPAADLLVHPSTEPALRKEGLPLVLAGDVVSGAATAGAGYGVGRLAGTGVRKVKEWNKKRKEGKAPAEGEKTSSLRETLTLSCINEDLFQVKGSALRHVGGSYTLDGDDTRLLMSALGVKEAEQIPSLIKTATQGPQTWKVAFPLVPRSMLEQHVKEAKFKARPVGTTKEAQAMMGEVHRRRDAYAKVAAMVNDSATIDSLLGLGVLEPHNLATFTSALPDLEKAQSTLCDMLLASRLGLHVLDDGALERAIPGLEAAIEGAFQLRFREDAPV